MTSSKTSRLPSLGGQLAERLRGSRAGAAPGPCCRRSARAGPRRPARGEVEPGRRRRPATSLNGQRIVSCAAPAVTPGLLGVPSVVAAEPACTRKAVDVAVIVAGHLDDLRSAGDPARQPHGRHGRLGARRDEPDLLDRRQPPRRRPRRSRSRARVGAPKLEPSSRALDHRRSDLRDAHGPGSSGPTSRCSRCTSGRRCRADRPLRPVR